MGTSSQIGGLPPLPPGATMTSSPASGAAPSGLPPLPPGAKLATPPPSQSPEDAFFAGHPVLSAAKDIIDAPTNFASGFAKSAVSGVGGILHLLGQYGIVPLGDPASSQGLSDLVTGKNKGTSPYEVQSLKDAGDYLQQHFQQHGVAEHIGGAAELVSELLSPMGLEEAPAEGGRALSFAERMAEQGRVAKFLASHPKLAALTAVGARATHAALKTAAETGAQTFVHTGGDTGAATQAAEVGGATAGVASPIADAVSSFLANRVPQIESIAGEQVPTVPSQTTGGGGPPIQDVPAIAKQQQAAAPRIFQNLAQRATKTALDAANEGRAIPNQITDAARLLEAPEGMKPYQFTIRGTAPTEGTEGEILQPAAKRPQAAFKNPQYLTSSAPTEPVTPGNEGTTGADVASMRARDNTPQRDVATGGGDITTADAETAQMHLSRLNDLADNPPPGMKPEQVRQIQNARDHLQEQMDVYHAYQRTLPNFAPVDSARAAGSVANFGEAADQLQNAAKPIYQKIDEATNGRFNDLNRARVAAFKRGDFIDGFSYEDKLDDLVIHSQAITPAERLQATKLWADSKVLSGIDAAIEHAANVNERYAAQVAGGRVLSGSRMQNGLDSLIQRYGTGRIEGVIGQDGMENLTRIANLLKLPPQEQNAMRGLSMSIFHNLAHGKVGGAVGAVIGHHVGGFEGALAGSYAGAQAERWVLRQIATSPRAGQLFDYAVRNNVSPKVATGLISAEIMREREEQTQQPPQGETAQ